MPESSPILERPELYHDRCWQAARSFGSAKVNPEDLAQELFLKLMAEKDAKLIDNCVWLRKIARNLAIDTARRERRSKPIGLEWAIPDIHSNEIRLVDGQDEVEEFIHRLMPLLTPHDQAILSMFVDHRLDLSSRTDRDWVAHRFELNPHALRQSIYRIRCAAAEEKIKGFDRAVLKYANNPTSATKATLLTTALGPWEECFSHLLVSARSVPPVSKLRQHVPHVELEAVYKHYEIAKRLVSHPIDQIGIHHQACRIGLYEAIGGKTRSRGLSWAEYHRLFERLLSINSHEEGVGVGLNETGTFEIYDGAIRDEMAEALLVDASWVRLVLPQTDVNRFFDAVDSYFVSVMQESAREALQIVSKQCFV